MGNETHSTTRLEQAVGDTWIPPKRRRTAREISEAASSEPARHHTTRLKRAIAEVGAKGLRVIDTRTRIGRSLQQWRAALVQDLGGPQELSTQQQAIVDLCVRTKLIIDSIDAYCARQPSLVNHRKRAVFPVVMQREQLADSLMRRLDILGLKRQARDITLGDVLKGGKP